MYGLDAYMQYLCEYYKTREYLYVWKRLVVPDVEEKGPDATFDERCVGRFMCCQCLAHALRKNGHKSVYRVDFATYFPSLLNQVLRETAELR